MEAHDLESEISCPQAYKQFRGLISKLESEESAGMNLSSLENLINKEGREVLRLLLEEPIRDRGTGNIGSAVKGSDRVTRSHRRTRKKAIKTIFGKIEIERTIYSLIQFAWPYKPRSKGRNVKSRKRVLLFTQFTIQCRNRSSKRLV